MFMLSTMRHWSDVSADLVCAKRRFLPKNILDPENKNIEKIKYSRNGLGFAERIEHRYFIVSFSFNRV